MPRQISGIYTLPNGPVMPDTTIESLDENQTRNDIATELTNSLDRNGRGGMLAPFRIFDGTMAAPGLAWLNDPNSGMWREGADLFHIVAGGANQLQFNANGAKLENNFATGAFRINFSGVADRGLSFLSDNAALFTADGVGDVLRFTGAGTPPPTLQTGYLRAFVDGVGFFDTAGGLGNGLLLNKTTSEVDVRVGGAVRLRVGATTVQVFSGNVLIPFTSRLYFDGGSDTFMAEEAPNRLNITCGGAVVASFSPTGLAVNAGLAVPSGIPVSLDGGGDTYLYESNPNVMAFVCGGALLGQLQASGLALSVPLTVNGAVSGATRFVASSGLAGVNLGNYTHAAANPFGHFITFTGAAPNNATNYFIAMADTSGFKAVIYSNSGLHNTQANNVNMSDARTKTFDDAPMESVRAQLRALDIRMGRYVGEDGPAHPMLTAQQVATHFPNLVVPFAEGPMLGVKTHDLWMHHLAVTQEHDDEIEELKSRLAALERKLH